MRIKIRGYENTRTGRPLGSINFIETLEAMTGKMLRPRKPGPKKD
tara:strand:+ start:54 stop:188 length:135 start_codon:yes stop_codon:yes gene_type:complete